jgi:hypothetical protein
VKKSITFIVMCLILSAGMTLGSSRWKELPFPQSAAQFAFIDFADSLDGMLFSKTGVFAKTVNGGKSWYVDSVSLPGQVWDIKYFGRDRCWIQTDSSYYASLYYSSDGKMWVRRQLPDTIPYSRPACGFATEQKVFINTGKWIWGSNDGGLTWKKLYAANGSTHSISFADSTTGIATFSNLGLTSEYYGCLVLRTTNSGITWDTLYSGNTADDNVHFYTPMVGSMRWNYSGLEAMQWRSGMAFTHDAGKTFQSIETAATGSPDRLFPFSGIEYDASHRFMLSSESRIKTDSDGFFLIERNDNAGSAIISFESVSEFSNWILASGNRIFQSIDIPTEVHSFTDNPASSAMRLDQNYPNPFNPSTTISFSLPSKSFVSLKIFDALGREVSVVVFEELPAGNYSRQWNASNMASGVYFYRLQAGMFADMKRLLLLR